VNNAGIRTTRHTSKLLPCGHKHVREEEWIPQGINSEFSPQSVTVSQKENNDKFVTEDELAQMAPP
jgi:hypothetical protein